MKNRIFCLCLTGLIFFIIGCSTTSNTGNAGSSNNNPTHWIFDRENLEELNLSKNEIRYRDNPDGLPEGAQVNLFGKIDWFNSFLETFDLHESLSFENKEKLFDALFGFIPAEPTNDIYRAVALGGYFSNGSPLILYLRVARPSRSAPEGSKGILEFTGNFMAVRNNRTNSTDFLPIKGVIASNTNWFSNGVIFSDNLLVKASRLYSKRVEDAIIEEAGGDIDVQNINLADRYILDEVKENDEQAINMLNETFNNSTDDSIKAAAKLNTFLYYLSKGDVVKAEEAISIAAQLSKRVPDINPSFLRIINIEAPVMLRLYRNNMR